MAPRPRCVDRLGMVALCGLASACLAAWLAPFGWPFELFAHFRLQLLAGATVLCLALLVLRKPKLAVIPIVLVVPLLIPFVQHPPAAVAAAQCQSQPFRLVTANVEFSNHDHARFLRWLRPNGRLFVVRGHSPAMEAVIVRNDVNGPRIESLFETDLPYLVGATPAPKFEF